MSAVVRCLVCLLAVLWTVGRSGATQPQPSAGVGTALELDQLLKLIVQDVTANIQPLITKLASRIDRLDARLIPRLNSIENRLNDLDSKQDSLETRLDDLASRLDSGVSRPDPRLDELFSRINSTQQRLDSKLDEQASQLNSMSSSIDSRLKELVAERNERLNGISYRLEELANLTDPRLQPPPRDCSGVPAGSRSGIYLVQPGLDRSRPPVKAYCDLESDGGRWTVIQRRADIQPRQNFNRSWSEYREGFGDLKAEFWWGLENLWRVTGPQHRQYQLRVNLADFDGERRHASYELFRVESGSNGYRLTVEGYTGDAGNDLRQNSGQRFSTYDRDQDTDDRRHCASLYGAGWWYFSCYYCNLNGPYLFGQQDGWAGIIWDHWRHRYSLKETEMKIRPVDTD